MITTISLTVRDVYNHLSNIENFSRILLRAEKAFIEKYPMFEYSEEVCLIGQNDETDYNLLEDYFNLIMWDNLTFEQQLEFFQEYPDNEIMDRAAYEFKKYFVQSLQEDLNSLINELIGHVEFFSPLELK